MSGNWIQTRTGKQFDLLHPDHDAIDILDIAHSLSMQCRFTGHTREFMSVAQHCVLVSHLVPSKDALDDLMHDATEAYVTDLARPLKLLLPQYKTIEDNIYSHLAHKFGLSNPLPPSVKHADNISLMWERRDLMSTPPRPWTDEHLLSEVPSQKLTGLEPKAAREEFLDRFYELTGID